MNAIGYVRISKKGDDKSVSLDVQREQIAAYCTRQGFSLAYVVTHDGISGTKRARFEDLDAAVKEHGALHVVVYHLDRLARDASGLAEYLKQISRRGIQCHEVAGFGKINTRDAIGRFVTGMRSQADQYFAEVTSEKTAAALQHLRAEGKRFTRLPPLGYRYEYEYTDNDGKQHFRMEEEAEEQRALKILRDCHKAGLGARRALAVLKAEQYIGRQSLKAVWTALERISSNARTEGEG